jgi:hypothetical protein
MMNVSVTYFSLSGVGTSTGRSLMTSFSTSFTTYMSLGNLIQSSIQRMYFSMRAIRFLSSG